MEPELLRAQAELEKCHWWFVARRQILDRVMGSFGLPKDARILEAGCGTGGNLPLLARHGEVFAFDASATARRFAARLMCEVAAGTLPDQIPFAGEEFDLIVLLDVLEHIADDGSALVALRSRLRPGGRLLITVPALSALWSYHDERHQHFRRYGKGELRARLQDAIPAYSSDLLQYFAFSPGGRKANAATLVGGTPADDWRRPRVAELDSKGDICGRAACGGKDFLADRGVVVGRGQSVMAKAPSLRRIEALFLYQGNAIFPKTLTHLCIVHLVRASPALRHGQGKQCRSCGPDADISVSDRRRGRQRAGSTRGRLGRKLSGSATAVAEQLGQHSPVFSISAEVRKVI